jgi:hypothetical protein
MSIEDVPVGTNLISLSRARTDRGIEYTIGSKDDGWRFVLRGKAIAGAQHYLNGKPVVLRASGIRMVGRNNRVLVVQP